MESEMTYEPRTSDKGEWLLIQSLPETKYFFTCHAGVKPKSTEEDITGPPLYLPSEAASQSTAAVSSWTESLNRLQTVPAPRHKEGSVRIRYVL